MTRILPLMLMLVASLMTQAQIRKGAVLLGGQISYNRFASMNYSSTVPAPVSKSGNFTISAGRAVKENTVVGLTASYSSSKGEYFAGIGTVLNIRKERRSTAGVFYRKYKQLFKDLYFFGEGDLSYTSFYQRDEYPSRPLPAARIDRGGQFSITPGISYNIFRKLQVEVSIPSIFSTYYTRTSTKQDQFSVFTGLQNTNLGSLGIGFRVIL